MEAEPRYAQRGSWTDAICSVSWCDRGVVSKGLCQSHYRVARLGNDPETFVMRPKGGKPLGTRKLRSGYVIVKVDSASVFHQDVRGWIQEHRLVMQQHLGRPFFPDENVHHINGDKTDNRLENLELWTQSQPPGQRVEDKIQWATALLTQYGYSVSSPDTDRGQPVIP